MSKTSVGSCPADPRANHSPLPAKTQMPLRQEAKRKTTGGPPSRMKTAHPCNTLKLHRIHEVSRYFRVAPPLPIWHPRINRIALNYRGAPRTPVIPMNYRGARGGRGGSVFPLAGRLCRYDLKEVISAQPSPPVTAATSSFSVGTPQTHAKEAGGVPPCISTEVHEIHGNPGISSTPGSPLGLPTGPVFRLQPKGGARGGGNT